MWKEYSYLLRLPAEAYRGHAVVHWSMAIDRRKTGWLNSELHFRFRELLTHTAFRHHLICLCYVLMPDYLHLIWMGSGAEGSDQRIATRFFRKQLNRILRPLGFELQKQGHDHVLREEARKESVFETVAAYVLENPLRAGLVGDATELRSYPFSGCLVPGYPELDIWNDEYWNSFWKLCCKLRNTS